jgi:small subunit ribosomal protein S3
MKQRAESVMSAGAKGVKIIVSGRLGGAEMSRSEALVVGSVPLHTLEADIDFAIAPCMTTYGVIGVKVWIFRGMFGDAKSELDAAPQTAMTRARRRREGSGGPGQGGGPGRGGPGRGGPPRGRGGPGGPGGPGRGSRSSPAPAPASAPAPQAPQESTGQQPPTA